MKRMSRKPRVVKAIESHVCVDARGQVWTVRAGDCLEPSHAAVPQNPQHFAASDREQVTALLPEEPEPSHQAELRVRARRFMRLRGIALPNGQTTAGMTYVDAGDLLPRSHPAVRAHPQNFEPLA